MAAYELEPPIARRIEDLSERKEFLDSADHDELLALVHFAQQRTLERLEAQVALQRLREIVPELVNGN
jgi:hypothetical protein